MFYAYIVSRYVYLSPYLRTTGCKELDIKYGVNLLCSMGNDNQWLRWGYNRNLYARSRYQGQGQIITSHSICEIFYLSLPLLHKMPHISSNLSQCKFITYMGLKGYWISEYGQLAKKTHTVSSSNLTCSKYNNEVMKQCYALYVLLCCSEHPAVIAVIP